MDPAAATEFALLWLPAWTGNEPQLLLSFYAIDAFYSDPAVPEGLTGHAELAPYFDKLLGRFPAWTWRQTRSLPLPGGFLNYWDATIPVRQGEIALSGVCTVQIEGGLIVRNEVFFDRSRLVKALNG